MKRLLTIDGGGIRGLIPARVIERLEAATGRAACAQFDLIAGTSTGGIIACGLVAGIPAAKLADLYAQRGGEIFTHDLRYDVESGRGLLGPKYSAAPLERILMEVLGERWLSDAATPELLIPSFCCDPYGAWFFQSWRARQDPQYDFRLHDVARATSAAETYFPTAEVLARAPDPPLLYMMDGGTHSNNPTMAAVVAALELWPGEHLEIISIGTGALDTMSLPGGETQEWGLIEWAPHIANVCMDGSADTVTRQVAGLQAAGLLTCHRLQAVLPRAMALDDVSAASLAILEGLAAALPLP